MEIPVYAVHHARDILKTTRSESVGRRRAQSGKNTSIRLFTYDFYEHNEFGEAGKKYKITVIIVSLDVRIIWYDIQYKAWALSLYFSWWISGNKSLFLLMYSSFIVYNSIVWVFDILYNNTEVLYETMEAEGVKKSMDVHVARSQRTWYSIREMMKLRSWLWQKIVSVIYLHSGIYRYNNVSDDKLSRKL